MSSAPSPLSLSDFLTSPPPLDLASLPASSSLLARYSTHASDSTPGASGGTSSNLLPDQRPLSALDHHDNSQTHNDGGGQDEAFLDFTLSPDAHGDTAGGSGGGDGKDTGYGLNGEGMFGIHPLHQHQLADRDQASGQQLSHHHNRQRSTSSAFGGQSQQASTPHQGVPQDQQQTQPDLRALLESLGASAVDFDLEAASSPSSTGYPAALQLPQQLLLRQQHQLLLQQQPQQQHQMEDGSGQGSNGLLDLLPQLQGLAQLSSQHGGAGPNGLALIQQHLQNQQQQRQQQSNGSQPLAPDVSTLLALLGLPNVGGMMQQQQQQANQTSHSSQGQGSDATNVTLAKLRELQEMQQQQTALIQQQLNQIASFYQSNPGQQQAGGSGSTTSTTSPSSASVQIGGQAQHSNRQQQQSNNHGSGSSSSMPGESPHLNAQSYGFQHGRTGKLDGRGLNGLSIGPLPTPDHSGEIPAMNFTPHLMNPSGGMMSPVYLPGTSFNSSGGGPNGWRNTGEAYDRDGNLLMTPLISPAMTAVSHPTPGSTFQPLPMAHPSAGGDFFSPLTSPALGPSQFERGMSLHHNPHHSYIGTMSPHLLAQRSTPNSPLINGSMGPSGSSKSRSGTSRAARGPPSVGLDGLNGGKALTNRSKTRPSPIIKPVVGNGQPRRRSTINGPSGISSGGGSSAVGSPKTIMSPPAGQDGPQPSPSSQSHVSFQGLPASAIPMEVSLSYGSIQQSVSPASSAASGPALHVPNGPGHMPGHSKSASQHTFATDSSPSPIDFASMQMPPPPHPSQKAELAQALQPQQSGQVAPQTPATFLNLGHPAADQRAIYSEGNTVSPGIVVDPTAAAGSGSASASSAASNSSGSGSKPQLAVAAGMNGSLGGPSWQPTKQAVRIVGKSPLGSPALRPTDAGESVVDKGKGREMLIPIAKPRKLGKAAPTATPTAGTLKRATKGAKPQVAASSDPPHKPETKKTSHKAAEQKRRDSLKAGFDELRLLLPPINVELVDPDTGLPIAGASMPRLPARNLNTGEPNRNVSKVALLRCSNKHLTVLNGRIARRDEWISRLVDNIRQLRAATGLEGSFEGDDLLFGYDVDAVDREDDFGPINGDDGMDEDDELSGLRRMSDEQEDGEGDGEGLEPVAEEGPEDVIDGGPAAVAVPAPPAVALTRKKSLTKTGSVASVSRRSSTDRASATQASGNLRTAADAELDHDMDES